MELLYVMLWVVAIVGLYHMIVAERRWISYTGITILLIAMVVLAMRVGYGLHKCEPEPVTLYMELRVSNMIHSNQFSHLDPLTNSTDML